MVHQQAYVHSLYVLQGLTNIRLFTINTKLIISYSLLEKAEYLKNRCSVLHKYITYYTKCFKYLEVFKFQQCLKTLFTLNDKILFVYSASQLCFNNLFRKLFCKQLIVINCKLCTLFDWLNSNCFYFIKHFVIQILDSIFLRFKFSYVLYKHFLNRSCM